MEKRRRVCQVEGRAWAPACSLEDGVHILGCLQQFSGQEARVGAWKRECHRMSVQVSQRALNARLRTLNFILKATGSHRVGFKEERQGAA